MKTKTEPTQLDKMFSEAGFKAASTLWPDRVKAEKALSKYRGGADKRLEARRALSTEMTELSTQISQALDASDHEKFRDLVARHQALKDELEGADDGATAAKIEKAKQAVRDLDAKEKNLTNQLVGEQVDELIAAAEAKGKALAAETAEVIKLRNQARARGAKLKQGSVIQSNGESLFSNDPLRWLASRDAVRSESAPLPQEDAVSNMARRFARESSEDLYARAQHADLVEAIERGDLVTEAD